MSGSSDGEPSRDPSTRLIHPVAATAATLGAAARTVNPPIQRASTVLLPNAAALYAPDRPSYGRGGLGVQAALEQALAEMEGASTVCLYGSGAAAISGAVLSVLSPGDEILVADGAYRPTRRLCDGMLRRFSIGTRYFDARASAETVMAMAGPKTRAIMLESPASLTFEIQDIPAICAAAHARGLLTLMDNTWGAGWLFKPLAVGVDLSIQALTKYVSGGSDVFMGSVAVADPGLGAQLRAVIHDTGWAVSPDDCYALLRSLRSLPVRLERHGRSAVQVASWLQARPEVAEVLCPALPTSRDHALWRRDFQGCNGLFGLVLRPGPGDPLADAAPVHSFIDALELFGLGFSWGGFESLAIYSDPQVDRGTRPWLPTGPLVRLHVGLEAPEDLIADLARALDAYRAACEARA